MKINQKRTDSMKRKNITELKKIAESGSLSAAAAQYEINKRIK